jgi:hypothetical protein
MDELDKVWLACAIDGEGHISITKYPEIIIINTNYAFVAKAARLMKANVKPRKDGPYFRARKRKSSIVVAVLEQLLPYLIIKREDAEKAIAIIKSRGRDVRRKMEERIVER